MSIENTTRSDDRCIGSVPIVTEHARLRYRQRVDARSQQVDEDLREMFRGSVPYQGRQVNGAARKCGDHLLVIQEGERPVIKTVLRLPEGS